MDTTRTILRRILERNDLTTKEKLTGSMLAAHLHGMTQSIRVSRARMIAETGLSARSLADALHGLVAKGIITRQRTGRSAIYRFDDANSASSDDANSASSTLMISHMQTQQPTAPHPHAPSPMRDNLRTLEDYKRATLAN